MTASRFCGLTPKIAFAVVSFSLGELGDGLNIFQGVYLVGIGWNEGSVGLALSLMGLTCLLIQTIAGDFIDKTMVDRRVFLVAASLITALSASTILMVREGNVDHMLIFISKIIEGVAGSFIGPCLAALTLACFGPTHFDAVMANNIFWGHVGAVSAAVLAGSSAYLLYPNVKYSFLVIGFSALLATAFVPYLPEGDKRMGRGFKGKVAFTEQGRLETIDTLSSPSELEGPPRPIHVQQASTYREVFSDTKTFVLCLTGFLFHFANANVLLVLGELMGGDNEDGSPTKTALPLIAGAIVLAQFTMALANIACDKLTRRNVGRKPMFLAGLSTLPIRCALIIYWKDAGDGWLLSTQILDGLAGGVCGLLHALLVADITFGTGRFNIVMGLTASCFGLGATLSNFVGQLVVEKLGHVASLWGSFVLSLMAVIAFAILMPETMGKRGYGYAPRPPPPVGESKRHPTGEPRVSSAPYMEMT